MTPEAAERLYIVGKNTTGSTLSAGYHVCWANLTNASAKGFELEKPRTSNLAVYAGVLEDDAPSGAFRLVQVYGYNEKAFLRFESTGGTVVEGQIFGPVDGQWYAQSNGRSYAFGPIVQMSRMAANTFEGQGRVFIRAL